MNVTDVTKDFYSNQQSTPLRTTTGFRPLPEAPIDLTLSESQTDTNTGVRWTQKQGFRSMLLRFYLMKIVKEQEMEGVPMRYTKYIILGPVSRLSGKTATIFNYSCLDVKGSYEVSIDIWALGTVDMSAIRKTFWINQYSGAELSFRPTTYGTQDGHSDTDYQAKSHDDDDDKEESNTEYFSKKKSRRRNGKIRRNIQSKQSKTQRNPCH